MSPDEDLHRLLDYEDPDISNRVRIGDLIERGRRRQRRTRTTVASASAAALLIVGAIGIHQAGRAPTPTSPVPTASTVHTSDPLTGTPLDHLITYVSPDFSDRRMVLSPPTGPRSPAVTREQARALIAQRIVGDEHLVLFAYANVTATGLFETPRRTASGPPPFTGQTEWVGVFTPLSTHSCGIRTVQPTPNPSTRPSEPSYLALIIDPHSGTETLWIGTGRTNCG